MSSLLRRNDALEIASRRSRSPGYRVQKNSATFLRIFLGQGDFVREPRLQTPDRLVRGATVLGGAFWKGPRIHVPKMRSVFRPPEYSKHPFGIVVDEGWQWMRSLVAKMWQHTLPKIGVASLVKKLTPRQADDLILPLAILIGAVAFGLWRQRFAGALFAGVGLFFLARLMSHNPATLVWDHSAQWPYLLGHS